MDKIFKRIIAALMVFALLAATTQWLPNGGLVTKASAEYIDASDYLFDDDIIGQSNIYAYSLDEFVVDSLENYYDYYADDNDHNDGPEIEYDDEVYNVFSVESSDPSVVGVSDSVTGGYLLQARMPGVSVITVYHYGEVQNRDSADERIYIGNYDVFTIEVSKVPSDEIDFTEISNKTYTGSAIKPAFKLTYKNRTLTEGEDYSISYQNNVKVGTATVTATLMGYYDGVITEDFSILPTISKTGITLYHGTNTTLTVKSSAVVTWKSGNPSVATVSKGVVTAKKAGTATIYATTGGFTLSCKVTVKKRQIDPEKKTVYAGQKINLQYFGGTGIVTWKTSNKKIAKVGSKGGVTTYTPGKVTITGVRNGISKTCVVTVINQKLNTKKLNLGVGKKYTLTLKGAVSTVTWKTSNSKIVSVSKKGVIKGKKKGQAVITAVHAGKTYKCTVTVKK